MMTKAENTSSRAWRALPGACAAVLALAILVLAPANSAQAGQQSFASPDTAIAALVAAVKANDRDQLRSILGPQGSKLLYTGDAEADRQNRDAFVNAYGEGSKQVMSGGALAVVMIGKDDWPLPIPLVKSGKRWHFDARQGAQEIHSRRIGRNELSAIQVCLAIVDAEREYAAHDVDGKGLLQYAPRFVSSPGKHDGLYWQASAPDERSPLGRLLTAAAVEGDAAAAEQQRVPYHGYFYRILTGQGKDAPGGAYDYMVNGKMIGGFAVIAYPAHYGVSGVMSFMVNHDGKVYEKDLGNNTASIASRMTTYNPGAGWKQPAS